MVALLAILGTICTTTQDFFIARKLKILFLVFLPWSKSTTIGVFCRPPNQTNVMDLMVEKFSNSNLEDNYIYIYIYIYVQIHILRDFNINLFLNGNYILNRKKHHLPRNLTFYCNSYHILQV